MKIIGRRAEIEQLQYYYDDNKPNFITITGRRRVGKTFLIKNSFNNFFFSFFGMKNESTAQMFSRLSEEYFSGLLIENWNQAFKYLKQNILKDSSSLKKVIFLDEIPWLDKKNSELLNAIDYFWNSFLSIREDVLLIVSGSSTSWIISNILSNTGGLHNRVTGRITLSQFTLKETEQFFIEKGFDFSRKEILEIYNTFGGVPYYLDHIKKNLSVPENINNLFFNTSLGLKNEFNDLYASLFRNSKDYINIIRTISLKNKGLTRKEITTSLNISDNGNLTDKLNTLQLSDFIDRYSNYPTNKSNMVYQLVDNFSIFYLTFVENNNSRNTNYYLNLLSTPKYYSWCGYAFERTCLFHLEEIKHALGISGISTYTYSFQNVIEDEKFQIDLLISRIDNTINLCEIKNTINEYVVLKEEFDKIKRRKELFQNFSKNKGRIIMTLITSTGLKKNEYSYVYDKVVTLDDLFV
jgi:AAA+ ATPase superfamily predicted ATPase